MSVDEELLALIARAPQSNTPAETLPDLDLTALMSPAAQREMQAAQALTQVMAAAVPESVDAVPDVSSEALASIFASGNGEMDSQIDTELAEPPPVTVNAADVDLSTIWGGIERETGEDFETPHRAAAPPPPPVEPDLQSLFMNREAQDALEAQGMSALPPPSAPLIPHTFEGFEMRDFGGMELPTPQWRPRYASGGSQGTVVSQRTASGFRPTVSPAEAQRRWESRQAATAPPRPSPPAPVPSAPRLTLMQQLMSDD